MEGPLAAGRRPTSRGVLLRRRRTLVFNLSCNPWGRSCRLSSPVADLVLSFVHMHVNPLSRSAGPEHELVLYDFLARLYSSQSARASGRAAAKVPAEVESR
ncbi:MAG TPA: lantibiotic dehydratase C-terminal domain-containing protein [Thermoanaerobaculia bacterium]|nr:lantibiotic dehydratase C-terminal domain-containing protein [Thermoanaerobaculia bacterium]